MYVKVKVVAGARKERVKQVSDTVFEITVREPAERNMANKRLQEILGKKYGVPAKSIRMITGHHSPGKIFSVPIEEEKE